MRKKHITVNEWLDATYDLRDVIREHFPHVLAPRTYLVSPIRQLEHAVETFTSLFHPKRSYRHLSKFQNLLDAWRTRREQTITHYCVTQYCAEYPVIFDWLDYELGYSNKPRGSRPKPNTGLLQSIGMAVPEGIEARSFNEVRCKVGCYVNIRFTQKRKDLTGVLQSVTAVHIIVDGKAIFWSNIQKIGTDNDQTLLARKT